jgi:hypothetical protein
VTYSFEEFEKRQAEDYMKRRAAAILEEHKRGTKFVQFPRVTPLGVVFDVVNVEKWIEDHKDQHLVD